MKNSFFIILIISFMLLGCQPGKGIQIPAKSHKKGVIESLSPEHKSSNQAVNPVLSWTPFKGNNVLYNIYLDTDPSASIMVQQNFKKTNYYAGNLSANTTYYWKITAKNNEQEKNFKQNFLL